MKIDKTVKKETIYIATWTFVLSVLMQSVFLIIGNWDYKVFLGNLLGYTIAVLNFFLMGITVQKAVLKPEKEAKTAMKVSQTYRNLMVLIFVVVGIVLPCFNTWTVIIPVFFPRIAIAFHSLFNKE